MGQTAKQIRATWCANAARGLLRAVLLAVVCAGLAAPVAAQEHAEVAQEQVGAAAPEHAATPQEDAEAPQEHAGAPDAHAADEHAGEHAGPSWTEYAYKWINFILLVGVMYWLLVVPPAFVVENFEFEGLKVVLAARVGAIASARKLAEEQRLEAETRQTASLLRLDKVDTEVSDLLAEADATARADRQRIEAAAVRDAEQIRAGAVRDMNSEVVRARRDLRRHVADLSVAIATGLVKDSFSSDDQERLVRRYLDHLGETVA